MSERWLGIPGYPGYEVSDAGRVRRITGGQGARLGRVLRVRPCYGYRRVALYLDGRRVDVMIHRLVLTAFVGPAEGRETNHRDGDKTNNALPNLEWVSHSANMTHALASGLWSGSPSGEANGNAKLTAAAVMQIRDSSDSTAALARRFGVTWRTVDLVRRGVTWRVLA